MRGSKDALDVLIIGAGPTGLTAAIDLARRKIPFRIIDRSPKHVSESRAAGVWARTLEMLRKLDVAETMVKRGHPLRGMQAMANGQQLFELSVSGIDSEFPFILSIPQFETEKILIERLESLGGEVEREVELVDIKQDDEAVKAVVSIAGARGARSRETIRARWVLACDGAHSQVRKSLGISFHGSAYEITFALADVFVEWDRPANEAHAFLSAEGPIAFLPFRKTGHYRIVAQIPTEKGSLKGHGKSEDMGLADFEEHLRGRVPVRYRLYQPQWIATFHIHHRLVDRYRKGRIFLVGDAAHIHSPVGGQGMNTGIQDALDLTWKLAAVLRDAAPVTLLDTYETERRPVAAGILRGTDIATRLATLSNPYLQWLRNLAMQRATRIEWLRHRFIENASELTVHYPYSPLVGASRRPARGVLPPGRRAPDGEIRVGEKRSRLHTWLENTEHAFLLFAGEGSETSVRPLAQEVVRRFGNWADVLVLGTGQPLEKASGLTVAADASDLHARFGVKGPALFWIRPDGYIGYRSEPVEIDACEAFLATTFDLKKMPTKTKTARARSSRTRAAK